MFYLVALVMFLMGVVEIFTSTGSLAMGLFFIFLAWFALAVESIP